MALVLFVAFQSQSSDARCDSARFSFIDARAAPWPLEDRRMVGLRWTRPARFPDAAKTESERGDFSLSCEGWSAEQRKDVFAIRGTTIEALTPRLQDLHVLKFSGWEYPEIRVGFFSLEVSPKLTSRSVSFEFHGGSGVWRDAVIAARVNDGDLQPALFDGKVTPISILPADRVEFYVKGGGVQIAKFSIDTKAMELKFWRQFPFPSK